MSLIMDEKQRQKLLIELTPWWTSQGWNQKTLSQKSLRELFAIKGRMNKVPVAKCVSKESAEKFEQLSFKF